MCVGGGSHASSRGGFSGGSVQVCSVPRPDGSSEGHEDDSAESLFQTFLREAILSTSGVGKDVHYLMLPVRHFFCRPRRRPSFKLP